MARFNKTERPIVTRVNLPRLLALLCIAWLTGCGPSYEVVDHTYDPAKSDKENLLGEWVCVEATTAGQPDEELQGNAIEFQEDQILMKAQPRNDRWVQTNYELDTEADPNRLIINAKPVGSAIPQLWIDLYRFEDGSLILSRGEQNSVPLSFESTPENGYSRLVYKRVK